MAAYTKEQTKKQVAALQRGLEQRIAAVTPPVTTHMKTGNVLTQNNNAQASIRKNGK